MDFLFYILLAINLISGILLLPYPINLFFLAISSRNWEDPPLRDYYEQSELPEITIQLPVYNESLIIHRTLLNLSKLLYPLDKLRIQILDDSTDDTSSIIDSTVTSLKKQGFSIEIIRRNNREGYKAGALANGFEHGVSEFVAIFDSDFLVKPDFLEKTIHYFKNNDDLGAVQTRWDHSNLYYSLFTRSMSIGLDGHFLVEKPGRRRRNAFITFNGTGGVWRRSAVEKCGGWSSMTLAEDLDLAYRAQMEGYEIIYLRNVSNSQEIPPTIRCWIIQQSRWAKGFSQNLRKNYRHFLRNSQKKSRIQGSIHLTQYFVPLLIVLNTVTSSILLYFPMFQGTTYLIFGLVFSLATILGIIAYVFSVLRANRPMRDILLIPFFLFWGAALVVRMGLGTISGLCKKGGEFVRTPKFNLSNSKKGIKIDIRERIPLDKVFIAELVYLTILSLGLVKGIELGGMYLSQVAFYLFLILSMLNLVVSELLHALAK
ncbi:MAG: glycosyltransferase [Candidatus Heimdallarchaeota archaeon]|nr:MAG: glycosyltransferase [Candidatus Heimdallarchaeota archaeon]